MSHILTQRFYKRFISALILGPLTIGLFIIGGIPFYILIGVISGFALAEWISLSRKLETMDALLFGFTGVLYIVVSFSCFLMLPPYLNLLFVLGVWGSDIGAYFVGKKFGRIKVFPTISPNKTEAGFLGACLTPAIISVVLALILNMFFPVSEINYCALKLTFLGDDFAINPFLFFDYFALFSLFFMVGIAGQAGDLMISAFKRKVDVKDTGSLIPGHGGILDRIDALLFASIVFYISLESMSYILC